MEAWSTSYCPVVLCLILFFIEKSDAATLHRREYCQLYGQGGKADVQPSVTLGKCKELCNKQQMPPCEDTILLSALECCLYYDRKTTFVDACNTLVDFKQLYVVGCEGIATPKPRFTQRLTPPIMKTTPRFTTTTTTTMPPIEEVQTTAVMTTEADSDMDEEGIPPPENPELCEEIIVTGKGRPWSDLQTKLHNTSANYFCHQLCRGPLPPKYYWMKPDPTQPECRHWGNYDSSLCAFYLDTIMKKWNEHTDGTLTLTLCSSPAESADVTTESMVTADMVTGMTDGNVTDSNVTESTGATMGLDITTAVP